MARTYLAANVAATGMPRWISAQLVMQLHSRLCGLKCIL